MPTTEGPPIEVLRAAREWAAEPIAVVCDEYEITRGDVLVACWYAATYGTHELRKYRRQWREWADEVHGDLWKVTAVDYDKIPLPPGVGP